MGIISLVISIIALIIAIFALVSVRKITHKNGKRILNITS